MSLSPGSYYKAYYNFDVKAVWIILSLFLGLLLFAIGCLLRADILQFLGAIVLIPGLIGLSDASGRREAVEGK